MALTMTFQTLRYPKSHRKIAVIIGFFSYLTQLRRFTDKDARLKDG